MKNFDIGELVLSKIDTVSLYQSAYKNIVPFDIDSNIPLIILDKIKSKHSKTEFYFCLYFRQTVLLNSKIIKKFHIGIDI